MATEDQIIAEAKGFAGAAASSEEAAGSALGSARLAARVVAESESRVVTAAGEVSNLRAQTAGLRDETRIYHDSLASALDGVVPGNPIDWVPEVTYPAARWVAYKGSSYRSIRDSRGVEPGTAEAIDVWILSSGVTAEVEAARASAVLAASSAATDRTAAAASATSAGTNASIAATSRSVVETKAAQVSEDASAVAVATPQALAAATAAQTAATQAALSAAAALASGVLYATTAAGLAATVDGEFFLVVGDNTNSYADLYENEDESATLRTSYPSKAALDAGVAAIGGRVEKFEDVIDPEAPSERAGIVGAVRRWFALVADASGVRIGGARHSGSANAEAVTDGRGWVRSRQRNDGTGDFLGMTYRRRVGGGFDVGDRRGWSFLRMTAAGVLELLGNRVGLGNGALRIGDKRGWQKVGIDENGNIRLGRFVLDVSPGPVALRISDSFGHACLVIENDGAVRFKGTGAGSGGGGTTAPIVAEPVMATALYMRDDKPLPLYVRNLLEERTDTARVRATFWSYAEPIGDTYALEADDVLSIEPARCGTAAELVVRAVNQDVDTRHVVTLDVRKADTTATGSPAATVLMIGDSITNAGMIDLVDRRLQAWGYAPTFIGTVASADYLAATGSDADGPPGEARTGRRLSHLTFRQDDADVDVLPVGDEASYLALAKASKLVFNPFLRPTEEGDNADLVQNGHVFDLAFYLDRFSLAPPDIVVLGLGTNDWRNITGEPLTTRILADLAIVLPQIRAALPGATILVWLPTFPRAAIRDAVWKEGPRRVQQAVIQYVRELADAGVHVVPVWASTSQEAGYLLDDAATVDDATGVLTADIDDSIHPFTIARGQIADVLAAAIAVHS